MTRSKPDLGPPVEIVSRRNIRARNKLSYRFAHWPIWVWVFFIAPGPLTFDLFESGFDSRMGLWLCVVLVCTALAGVRGRLPGVEPRPYIIRFTEDKPNPLYRRVCYTFAWSAAIVFAVLNVVGLVDASISGTWHLRQFYETLYFPLATVIWLLGFFGLLPRGKSSTKGEGNERRYFYGTIWAVCIAQPALWLMWKLFPVGRFAGMAMLLLFITILVAVGQLARRGRLPRTRPIIPGEVAISD